MTLRLRRKTLVPTAVMIASGTTIQSRRCSSRPVSCPIERPVLYTIIEEQSAAVFSQYSRKSAAARAAESLSSIMVPSTSDTYTRRAG